MDDSLAKRPKYNIDWSSARVTGDEQEVKMRLSSETDVVEKTEAPNKANDVKVDVRR